MAQPQPPAGEIILTYDDYLQFPNDGRRYEILEGVLYMTPAPVPKHQKVSINLEFLLYAYVTAHDLGEVYHAPIDVVLSRTNVTQPDIIFIGRERLDRITAKNVSGAPDLVVEILSPSTSQTDRLVKAQIYARYGVSYYWLLDPDQQELEEYVSKDGTFTLLSRHQGKAVFPPAIFPGWEIDLGRVWGG